MTVAIRVYFPNSTNVSPFPYTTPTTSCVAIKAYFASFLFCVCNFHEVVS